VIDAPIGRDPRSRTRMAVTERGKPARTAYRVIDRYGRAALVECRLETGRTHQIRVHMRAIGHPLVGDPTYGSRDDSRDGSRVQSRAGGADAARGPAAALAAFPRQALHAARLGLIHPATGDACEWRSDPPADLRELVRRLRR
jgi:23S rRNA pseudouridine1911/1915/1917 synthase